MTEENAIISENDAPLTDSSPETTDTVETEQGTPEEAKKNPVQERINKITREKYEERRAREEAEKKAQELEERLLALENRIPPEPKEMDFDSNEEYIAAVKEHAKKAALAEARQSGQSSSSSQDNGSANVALQKVQMAIAKSDIPDLQQVVSDPNLPIDANTIEWLSDSDKSDLVLYHLGTHLDEAYDIAQMSPAQKFRALSKLEAKLERATPNKVSNAPTPPDPIGNSDGSPMDESKMSTDEWIKRRNAKVYGSS